MYWRLKRYHLWLNEITTRKIKLNNYIKSHLNNGMVMASLAEIMLPL